MGDADTSAGQYTQLFANQQNPADTDIDPVTPSALPTPTTAAAPDVVQVMPASSPNAVAGTPVTIEGNYFNTAATPQVFFGGVAATNVHVNWDGELSADAPADPAGTARDQVVVTVSTTAGSSSSSGTAQVNEFTYAPTSAPTVTSVSSASGPEIPSGTVIIHGTNFVNGGVAPIVDFGTVASIGSMTYSGSTITTTIPPSIEPGLVNITVTTPAGTSAVSAADQYTYTGSGSTAAARHHQRQPRDVLSRHRPACSTSRRPGRPASARSATPPSAGAPRRPCRPASASTTRAAPLPPWTGRHSPVTGEPSPSASSPPTA